MHYTSKQLTRLPKPWNLPHNGRLILIFTELCKVFPEGMSSHQLSILLKIDRKYISLGLKKLMESETIECKAKKYYVMLTIPHSTKSENQQHEKRKHPSRVAGSDTKTSKPAPKRTRSPRLRANL